MRKQRSISVANACGEFGFWREQVVHGEVPHPLSPPPPPTPTPSHSAAPQRRRSSYLESEGPRSGTGKGSAGCCERTHARGGPPRPLRPS